MLSKSILGLFVAVMSALVQAAPLEEFKEIVAGGEIVSTGSCEIRAQTFICDLLKKNDKEYLLVYKSDGTPYLVIRQEDKIVIWVAGVTT